MLIVQGLSLESTNKSVFDVFASFGDLKEVRLIRDYETGASKGFAFLEFASDTDSGLLNTIRAAVPAVKVDGASVIVEYSRGGEARDAPLPQKNSKVASAAIEAAMAMSAAAKNPAAAAAAAAAAPKAAAAKAAAASAAAAAATDSTPAVPAGLVYDPTTQFYYDPKTLYYWDATTGYYYEGTTGTYLTLDPQSQAYAPVTASQQAKYAKARVRHTTLHRHPILTHSIGSPPAPAFPWVLIASRLCWRRHPQAARSPSPSPSPSLKFCANQRLCARLLCVLSPCCCASPHFQGQGYARGQRQVQGEEGPDPQRQKGARGHAALGEDVQEAQAQGQDRR